MRGVRPGIRVLAAVVLVAALATSCSDDPNRAVSMPTDRGASAAVAAKVVGGAFEAFKRINACVKNREVGQPCLASDSDNIRQTLKEVKELRTQIEQNQTQVLAEFDAIRALIRDQNVRQLSDQLRSMVINTGEAEKAYEAMSVCAASTTTTCRPFIGRAGDPLEDVATAIMKTKAYFLEVAGNLPRDLPVTVSWFTGTAPSYDNGLADAIWMYNKGAQDQAAGVTDVAVKNSRTVPILTKGLVDAQNREVDYWGDMFSSYAFVAVQYAGFGGDDLAAERRQAQADTWILDEASRSSVSGTIGYYGLPGLSFPGVVIVTDGTKAWMISNRNLTMSRPLQSDDVAQLASIINDYSSVSAFLAVPDALPPGGKYEARASIERVKYVLHRYVVDRDYSRTADAAWLVEPSSTSSWCATRVQALDAPQTPPGDVKWIDGEWFTADPAFVPKDRLLKTWERFAKDKPIGFEWSVSNPGSITVGWGAWIKCHDVNFTGVVVPLLKVPPVMGPAK